MPGRRAFILAREYKTYSHAFIRGLLESRAVPQIVDPEGAGVLGKAASNL